MRSERFVRRTAGRTGGRLVALVVTLAAAMTVALVTADPVANDATPSLTPIVSAGRSLPAFTQSRMPTAVASHGTAAVGVLVRPGGLSQHFCTASVVDSAAGDLVLTAAHCVTSGTSGLEFAPAYHDGHAPDGLWRVDRIVVDPSWQLSSDPDDDFAFLVVARSPTGKTIQQVTGGERLGVGEPAGQVVSVTGYPDGDDSPISCENTVTAFSPTQFEFDCGGYLDGTSGSPLLVNVSARTGLGTVIGVIGGFEQGGSLPQVSYAARFGSDLATLYRSAAGSGVP